MLRSPKFWLWLPLILFVVSVLLHFLLKSMNVDVLGVDLFFVLIFFLESFPFYFYPLYFISQLFFSSPFSRLLFAAIAPFIIAPLVFFVAQVSAPKHGSLFLMPELRGIFSVFFPSFTISGIIERNAHQRSRNKATHNYQPACSQSVHEMLKTDYRLQSYDFYGTSSLQIDSQNRIVVYMVLNHKTLFNTDESIFLRFFPDGREDTAFHTNLACQGPVGSRPPWHWSALFFPMGDADDLLVLAENHMQRPIMVEPYMIKNKMPFREEGLAPFSASFEIQHAMSGFQKDLQGNIYYFTSDLYRKYREGDSPDSRFDQPIILRQLKIKEGRMIFKDFFDLNSISQLGSKYEFSLNWIYVNQKGEFLAIVRTYADEPRQHDISYFLRVDSSGKVKEFYEVTKSEGPFGYNDFLMELKSGRFVTADGENTHLKFRAFDSQRVEIPEFAEKTKVWRETAGCDTIISMQEDLQGRIIILYLDKDRFPHLAALNPDGSPDPTFVTTPF